MRNSLNKDDSNLNRTKKMYYLNMLTFLIYLGLFISMILKIITVNGFFVLCFLNTFSFILSFIYLLQHLKDVRTLTVIANKRIRRKIKRFSERLDHGY